MISHHCNSSNMWSLSALVLLCKLEIQGNTNFSVFSHSSSDFRINVSLFSWQAKWNSQNTASWKCSVTFELQRSTLVCWLFSSGSQWENEGSLVLSPHTEKCTSDTYRHWHFTSLKVNLQTEIELSILSHGKYVLYLQEVCHFTVEPINLYG